MAGLEVGDLVLVGIEVLGFWRDEGPWGERCEDIGVVGVSTPPRLSTPDPLPPLDHTIP